MFNSESYCDSKQWKYLGYPCLKYSSDVHLIVSVFWNCEGGMLGPVFPKAMLIVQMIYFFQSADTVCCSGYSRIEESDTKQKTA